MGLESGVWERVGESVVESYGEIFNVEGWEKVAERSEVNGVFVNCHRKMS